MHPYYVATQAHPEFRSRPTRAHPLFAGLVAAALARKPEQVELPDVAAACRGGCGARRVTMADGSRPEPQLSSSTSRGSRARCTSRSLRVDGVKWDVVTDRSSWSADLEVARDVVVHPGPSASWPSTTTTG